MTDQPNQVQFARRFVVCHPDRPDMHGVQFPNGTVIADDPDRGLVGAITIEALCELMTDHTVHWADEETTT